jgi:hypothetical protein
LGAMIVRLGKERKPTNLGTALAEAAA